MPRRETDDAPSVGLTALFEIGTPFAFAKVRLRSNSPVVRSPRRKISFKSSVVTDSIWIESAFTESETGSSTCNCSLPLQFLQSGPVAPWLLLGPACEACRDCYVATPLKPYRIGTVIILAFARLGSMSHIRDDYKICRNQTTIFVWPPALIAAPPSIKCLQPQSCSSSPCGGAVFLARDILRSSTIPLRVPCFRIAGRRCVLDASRLPMSRPRHHARCISRRIFPRSRRPGSCTSS